MVAPPRNVSFDRQPMLWLATAFAVGILAEHFVDLDLRISAAACVVFALASIIVRVPIWRGWLVGVAFVLAGAASLHSVELSVRHERLRSLYDSGEFVSGTPVEVDGVLKSSPESAYDGQFLTLRSETIRYRGESRNVSGNVRIFVPSTEDLGSEISGLKYGSRVRIACALEREDEYLNPGVQPRRELLDRQDVDAACSLKSSLLMEHTADESVFIPLAWVYGQRAALIEDFRNDLSPSAAGVMIASLLGDKYFLDKTTADLFREGGTFHILVISGLHITFIGGLLLLLVRWMTRSRWIQFGVTAGVLWGYTLAVGADVPVVRAAVMFTTVLFGYAIHRKGSLLNSLGFCGFLLLVWRPADLFNPSLHLTLVSVGAIVAVAYPLLEHLRNIGSWTPTPSRPFPPNVPNWLRRLCETLYWRESVWAIESKRNIWSGRLVRPLGLSKRIGDPGQKCLRYVFEALLVSAVVQFAMLPLSVIYFHRVAFGGILLNLWVSLFIAIESFAAVLGSLASHFSVIIAAPFFAIANAANWLMLGLPKVLAAADWTSFRIPAYSGDGRLIYLFYFFPVVLFGAAIAIWDPFGIKQPGTWVRRSLGCNACASAALAAVVLAHPFSTPPPDGRLHIDFLDVGQGDSALITFPDGATWLVDGGGRQDYRDPDDTDAGFVPDSRSIGESVVSEVLWYKGYSHIDHILATHADADHIQGLNDVARNFSVDSAMFGRTPADDPEFSTLADILEHRAIPVETLYRGESFEAGGAVVEVLYPLAADPAAPSDNNHSLVIRVRFGSRAFLLTGDIEEKAEADLLANGGTLAADLVKVAHHGSRTSSTPEFIAASHPQFAVISVGRRSPFGHPHADVVERWQAAGAGVVTTGENGMISVSTDGRDLQLTTFAH